jgi:gamma-glutamyltranspeptidase/glutathione hydrolase
MTPRGSGVQPTVATSHPEASRAAVGVMRRGGNAVDAAVAAAAVLGVVEPHASGAGGDCFALVAPGLDPARMLAYNGSGQAPAGASTERLLERGVERIAPDGAEAVTVPGAVDAWERLVSDHGQRSLADVLRPAADLAERGFAVTPAVAAAWRRAAGRLHVDPAATRTLLVRGAAPAAGATVRLPGLAVTLRRIARDGAAGFYTGEVAEDLVETLRARGGPHTLADFAAARGEYVRPIRGAYRDGADVWECPPNGQGVIALQILAVLAGLRREDPLGADRLHVFAEAARLGLADRDAALADPDAAPAAAAALLDDARIRRLRDAIDLRRAGASVPPPMLAQPSTTAVVAVDTDGTLVSLVSSVFEPFGSGIVGPRSGVLLHNRGAGFVVEPGHPNTIAPRRRPLHTIIPAIASVPGHELVAFGVTGGDYQAPGHAWLVGNLVDYGMGLQAAIDFPRLAVAPGRLTLEPSIPEAVAVELAARGHRVERAAKPIGSAQAVTVNAVTGATRGAADGRRDGSVMTL